jgi:hypothetical protein
VEVDKRRHENVLLSSNYGENINFMLPLHKIYFFSVLFFFEGLFTLETNWLMTKLQRITTLKVGLFSMVVSDVLHLYFCVMQLLYFRLNN